MAEEQRARPLSLHFRFVTDKGQPAAAGPGRPLRVLWLIKGLGPGGAERLLVAAARERSADIEATVAYALPHKTALVADLESAGITPRCLGVGRRTADPRWALRLRRALIADRYDIVHVHSPVPAVAARLILRTLRHGRRPALVSTEHNVWSSHGRLTRWANRLTGRLDDATLAVSDAVRSSMPRQTCRATEVVRYGVDLAAVRAATERRGAIRAELGIADDQVLVVTVANLRATKGYPDLLAAARQVVDRHPDVVFAAVGQGPMEAELLDLHRKLDLGDRFRFLGYRDDAVAYSAAADVFCLASHHEGLPIALIEAMALGRAIVATRVGGNEEIVAADESALLVPPRDPAALARALVEVVSDPARRQQLGEAARTAADRLDVRTAIRAVEDRYRALATARSRR
jgi:glycosyltransferase involved in cell wall biosynthesis